MLLYLLGPSDDWAFSLVNGLADVLDDTPSCPDHQPLRDKILYDAVLDTAGLHYGGPFTPFCDHCSFPEPTLASDMATADVVFFWLPKVTPFLAAALAASHFAARNVWVGASVPLPAYLDSYPDDVVYSIDPATALRTLVNRHYPSWLHVMPYEDYLKTPSWAQTRQRAILRAQNRCQLCNKPGPLQVHHRTYANRGLELPEDLIALCPRDHDTFHGTVRHIGPAMRGPDLRKWKLASITRYFATPAEKRVADERAYRPHGVAWLGLETCEPTKVVTPNGKFADQPARSSPPVTQIERLLPGTYSVDCTGMEAAPGTQPGMLFRFRIIDGPDPSARNRKYVERFQVSEGDLDRLKSRWAERNPSDIRRESIVLQKWVAASWTSGGDITLEVAETAGVVRTEDGGENTVVFDLAVGVSSGHYHARIARIERVMVEDKQAIQFTFKILAGTNPSMQGRVHVERLPLVESSVDRLKLWAVRLGLVDVSDVGRRVTVHWLAAMGRQVVLQLVPDRYRTGESRIAYDGIWLVGRGAPVGVPLDLESVKDAGIALSNGEA